MNFNWQLAYTEGQGAILMCIPLANDGKTKLPFELAVWDGSLSKFSGEIILLGDDGETIEISGSDIFDLIQRLESKVSEIFEGA